MYTAMNTKMNLRVPYAESNFLTSLATTSFWRRTSIHEVSNLVRSEREDDHFLPFHKWDCFKSNFWNWKQKSITGNSTRSFERGTEYGIHYAEIRLCLFSLKPVANALVWLIVRQEINDIGGIQYIYLFIYLYTRPIRKVASIYFRQLM
jgi:hypothetical protein